MSFTFAPLTRRTGLGLATLSLAALAMSAAHPAAAQTTYTTTITDNGSTFTPVGTNFSDLDSSGFIQGGKDDYAAADARSPGQAFTTGSNAGGYLLNSLTQKGGGIAGNGYETGNFVVAISSVSGTTLTLLDTFTASPAAVVGASDFFTINLLPGNLTLAPNTQYAYDIYSTNGYYGLDSSGITPASGEFAFVGNSLQGVSTSYNAPTEHATIPYDRTYSIGVTANAASAAPEPSQTAGLGFAVLGVLGLLWKAKKRSASELAA